MKGKMGESVIYTIHHSGYIAQIGYFFAYLVDASLDIVSNGETHVLYKSSGKQKCTGKGKALYLCVYLEFTHIM
jgi:hypothetical protein